MKSDTNEAPKPLPEQEPQSQNLDPKVGPEATAKCAPADKPVSDALIEYWANGFRVPTE